MKLVFGLVVCLLLYLTGISFADTFFCGWMFGVLASLAVRLID